MSTQEFAGNTEASYAWVFVSRGDGPGACGDRGAGIGRATPQSFYLEHSWRLSSPFAPQEARPQDRPPQGPEVEPSASSVNSGELANVVLNEVKELYRRSLPR